MRFSGTQLEFKMAPPVLGQHTDEVLRSVLKMNDGEIAKLKTDGIV